MSDSCDPRDCSLPGSSVHGIFQGRILECVAISSSKESCQPRDQTQVSCISCIADRFFTAEPLWYGEHGKIWMGCGFSRADNKDEKRSGTASDIGKSWISCEVFSFFNDYIDLHSLLRFYFCENRRKRNITSLDYRQAM